MYTFQNLNTRNTFTFLVLNRSKKKVFGGWQHLKMTVKNIVFAALTAIVVVANELTPTSNDVCSSFNNEPVTSYCTFLSFPSLLLSVDYFYEMAQISLGTQDVILIHSFLEFMRHTLHSTLYRNK